MKCFKNNIKLSKPLIAFFASFILGCIIVIPNIIRGKGIFCLISDFNVQQIPFNKMINISLKEGSFLWTWYNELGSNFVGTFSFYNLFSPFNILGYIFPASWFEYLIGPIFILKYAVSGLTSYLFLQRYVKDKKYAIFGSLLYTFSGFQLTNTLFYHFHDVVALFPLLLYTLDNLIYDNKKIYFGLTVFLLAATNWFFFIGEVVFVIMYYIIKLISRSYKFDIKKLTNIVIEAILGVSLAAFILLPTVLFTVDNPRIKNIWDLTTMFKYDDFLYPKIVASMIFPSQIMSSTAIISSAYFTSTELYLPFVGMILVFSYIVKNIKEWDSLLIITSAVFIFVPILNSIFFAFTSSYYSRWFYMPLLICSLASARSLDKNCKVDTGYILNMFLIFIFCIMVHQYININEIEKFIFNRNYFLVMIIVLVLNLTLMYIINTIKKGKLKFISLFICTCGFICLWGNYTIYKYKQVYPKEPEVYENYLAAADDLNFQKVYRANSYSDCFSNLGTLSNNSNLKSFNSNINGSLFQFYYSIGYTRSVSTSIDISDKELNDFLGIEYIISCGSKDPENYGYVWKENKGIYSIYSNNDYKKLGFTVNKFISVEDFEKLDYAEKINTLNDSVVLNNEQIKKYQSIIENNASYELNEYEFVKNGLKANIISSDDTLAIYTIPYDEGWTVTVNGKKVSVEKVDNGFIGIKINKGNNEIEFKYFPPGLKNGLVISSCSLIIYIIYGIICLKGLRDRNEKRK